MAGIDFVECGEVRDVREEAGGLDGVREVGTGSTEDGGEVLADLLCLSCHVRRRDLADGGVDTDLSRGVDERADAHRLAVGAEGGGGVVAVNHFHREAPFINKGWCTKRSVSYTSPFTILTALFCGVRISSA